MKTVKKAVDNRINSDNNLAGGLGMVSAKQDAEALLRRAVMSCLLWEDLAYESGVENAQNIASLIPLVKPDICSLIAIEAKEKQKLRHVPLYIVSEMAKYDSHKPYVAQSLEKVIRRADEFAEFLAIYWKNGKIPIAKQIKVGLASAFNNFGEYQFAKYRGTGKDIKLRDVLNLVHPTPKNNGQSLLFKKVLDDSLAVPDTWETALSGGENKKDAFTRLILEKKLGGLAFLRNLRNMEESGVDHDVIKAGFKTINTGWLLPIHYITSAKYAPRWENEIESLMLNSFDNMPKLNGHTIFVVDVSGSMDSYVSGRSQSSRMDVANAMTIVASSLCETISIYATAGSDLQSVHKTELVPSRKGFGLSDTLSDAKRRLGGGGIFTRQCLDYIKKQEQGKKPERIIVFSDSQDCDRNRTLPTPFGRRNYIIDVSAHRHGINYSGIWDAEISGWSENFINYIMAFEGLEVPQQEN